MGKLVRRFFLDLGGGPEDCVVLAGSGRSGTTWVGEILNHRNAYRTLFEPFWWQRVPLVAHFAPWQYLPPDCTDERWVEPARRILSGRIRNGFVDSVNTKWIARKRLVKDIRANPLLGWLHARFPEAPIVLLLRHPCAVALSALKQGWNAPLRPLLAQEDLVATHLRPHMAVVEDVRANGSPFDRFVLSWCIENTVALACPDLCVVHYENLCGDDPRPEIERMFAHVGQPFDERVLDVLPRPSRLSAEDSAVVTGESLVERWRGQVEPAQIDRAVGILAEFGLDRLYDADPWPKAGPHRPL